VTLSCTALLGGESLEHALGEGAGRSRVLAGVQAAVDHDVGGPRLAPHELGTERDEPVLQQPRSVLGQPGLGLVGVGEAGQAEARERPAGAGRPGRQQAAGAWQTMPSGLPAASVVVSIAAEVSSTARSSIGPWPPG